MKTVKFMDWDCDVEFAQYQNCRVAILLVDSVDGSPIATATVNLPDERMEKDEVAIKDYSENEGMFAALKEAGLISDPIRYVQSGWVEVPICKLTTGDEPLTEMEES